METGGGVMDLGYRIGNAVEQAKGKAKQFVGKATGNERLANDGKADQAKAKMKLAARKIKDAVKDALD
ncbi:MAG: CsbD family protein [Nakamurella sp.]